MTTGRGESLALLNDAEQALVSAVEPIKKIFINLWTVNSSVIREIYMYLPLVLVPISGCKGWCTGAAPHFSSNRQTCKCPALNATFAGVRPTKKIEINERWKQYFIFECKVLTNHNDQNVLD